MVKMMSRTQKAAMEKVQKIKEQFGKDRWFIQAELFGVSVRTMDALVSKDYLDRIYYMGYAYYRIREKNE